MYSNYTMLEAGGTDCLKKDLKQAKKSILDVIKENPLWLNKVKDSLIIILKQLSEKEREFLLNKTLDEQIIELFIKIKTQYYYFKDVTRWKY